MIKNILKVVISIGLLVFLATKLEWSQVIDRAVQLDWWMLPVAVVIHMIVWALSNLRWWLLLRVHSLGHTYTDLLKPTFIGAFFNNLLPSSTGGDLFRMYHVYRQGYGAAPAVSPIITERAVGLLCMIALATLMVFQFGDQSLFFQGLRAVLFWLLAAGTAGMLIVSVPGTYYALHRFLQRWDRFRAVSALLGITEAVHTYLRRPGLLGILALVSLVLQGMQIIIFLILGAGVDAPLDPSQYLFIVPVVLVAASIPVTVGGLGVREAAAITLFTSAGMSPEHAAAVSLLFIPVIVLSGLPGLWFFLRMKGHRQFYDRATRLDFSRSGD
ncbi:MAG: lysylphosphatidylglycerol synthase transmembrane domain-containing protein [Gammaproteobacteria bacterium]|nr:lysylphosphatidylglycerol synthase transmembrane domain-containing protein [Gammaproteobacteria bacterium]